MNVSLQNGATLNRPVTERSRAAGVSELLRGGREMNVVRIEAKVQLLALN